MNKLSVIIPFVNEFPQVIFTVQNIAQELMGRVDFEIIMVDNYCQQFKIQVENQNLEKAKKAAGTTDVDKIIQIMSTFKSPEPDKGGETMKVCSGRINPWLKYATWTKNLSHWQAKRVGVSVATGDVFWFCDAHCIVSRDAVYGMYKYYVDNYEKINGSIHLPLTYKILESRRLIYKFVASNMQKGEIDYSFTPLRIHDRPSEVPCMSCCGVMLSRELYDEVGGWPLELGIYGGGEQFMNFTLSVLGKSKWIYPAGTLHHHGEPRSYHYLYDDYIRNKMIAAYLYGGKAWVTLFSQHTKGRPATLTAIREEVMKKCADHRKHIKSRQVMGIEDWAKGWIG
jgi:glycosyltransferase involved in cell wall biosynthesis